MKESNLWRAFRKNWISNYPDGYIVKISQRFQSGFPDCICIANGKVAFVELKVERNTVTKLQRKVLGDIAQAGGRVYILRKTCNAYAVLALYNHGSMSAGFDKLSDAVNYIANY